MFDAEAKPGEMSGERPEKDSDEAEQKRSGPGEEGSSSATTPDGDLWESGCLRLELSGEELRPGDLDNPVIVVANYVFDSLKQDAFRYHRVSVVLMAEGG